MEKDIYYESLEFALIARRLTPYDAKALNHPFVNKLPKHLYKYRKQGKLGRKEFYLGERNIYAASFEELKTTNDSFEGITPMTKQRIMNLDAVSICKYYKEDIISVLKEKVPSLHTDVASKIFDIILDEEFDKERIYKRVYPLVEEENKKYLKTAISALTYLFINLDDQISTNSDFKKGMEMFFNINNLMGAFCVCDTMSNDQLWSLYADGFSGYCIEYDLTEPCKSKGSIRFISNLYPVNYVKKKDDDWFKKIYESMIKTINIHGKASQFDSGVFFHQWLLKALCSKKDSWSMEKEWRFLGNANKIYKGPLISAIIVGHNINKEDFDEIVHYSEELQCELKITDIDYSTQEIIARDITEEDISKINKRV